MNKPLNERTIIAKALYWIMDIIEDCVPDRSRQKWEDVPKFQFWIMEFPLTCLSTLLLVIDFQLSKLNL